MKQQTHPVDMLPILLKDKEKSKPTFFLFNTAFIDKINHASIAKFVDESLCVLGASFKKDNFLLLVTDAADYMIIAGKHLSTFYVNMINLTCSLMAFIEVVNLFVLPIKM